MKPKARQTCNRGNGGEEKEFGLGDRLKSLGAWVFMTEGPTAGRLPRRAEKKNKNTGKEIFTLRREANTKQEGER